MLPLIQAIYAKAAATGAIVAAFPGPTDTTTATTVSLPLAFYHGAAPEGTALPYLVYTIIAAPAISKYGGVQRVEAQIQFAAFGVGCDATFLKLKTVTTAFDETILTLSGGHMVNTTRLGDPLPMFQDDIPGNKDGQGRDVWGWYASYEFDYTPS